MSFGNSPGIYAREIDQSLRVGGSNPSIGGVVIASKRGPVGKLTRVSSEQDFLRLFTVDGRPETDEPSQYAALGFLKRGNNLLVARANNDATAATYVVMDTATSLVPIFTINARDPGLWGNSIKITTSAIVADKFTITVKDGTEVVETFDVSRDNTLKDGFGRSLYIETVINGVSEYITIVDTAATAAWTALADQTLASGTDNTTITDSNVNTEWDRFGAGNVDVRYLIDGWATDVVATKMITLAETRRDCMAVLSVPYAVDSATHVDDIVTYVGTTLNPDTSHAAMYAGWAEIFDAYNDTKIYFPPAGLAAGVMAYTHDQFESWYSPSARRGKLPEVLGVVRGYTEADRDILYPARVNMIVEYPGEGVEIVGSKTLQTDLSATSYINVRFLLIELERNLVKALRPYREEFNDEFTRQNITSIVTNYLEDIKINRGLYGYAVQCDADNNPPAVVDANEMVIDAHIKPVRIADYIRLNLVLTSSSAQFSVS